MQYTNTGFSYNDIASKQNGVVTADLNRFYNALKDKNYVLNYVEADLLRFQFKVSSKLYLSLNATAKSFNSIMIPKELVGIFSNGTTPLVNAPSTFSMQGESLQYAEIGLGAAYQVNPKLSVGTRLKFLSGIASATTESSTGTIGLNSNYDISVSAGADVRTSGFKNSDKGKLGDYLSNSGFAFDIGGTYRLLEKLTLSASLLNIGSITWQNDLYGYTLDPKKATYTFKGIDMQKVVNGNTTYIDAEIDSLKKHFTFQEGVGRSYSTSLPSKIYLGGKYQLRERFSVGALLFSEQYKGRFSPGVSVSLQKDFTKYISTSLSYTFNNGIANNFGAGLSFNLSPVQLYFVGENLLGAPIYLVKDQNLNSYFYSTQNFNLRIGINFIFGKNKPAEKSPDTPTQESTTN
jgi:hypothetical protein